MQPACAEGCPEQADLRDQRLSPTADPRILPALEDAVALVNRLLDQAAELARYNFGVVSGIQVGIPESGWGFTRLEIVPRDAHAQPSEAPLHLHIETDSEPSAPETMSATIEYTPEGRPLRVTMTEYGWDRETCKAICNVNEKTGKLSVLKVEHVVDYGNRIRLLYKRGQPRYDAPKPRGRQS